jgi:SAM-dependent methyltransferase
MVNKLMKIWRIILRPKLLKQIFRMSLGGYLHDIGWFQSFDKQLPVDQCDRALPWVTYGFIDFISERLNENLDVFEYGSGNSTEWYAKKVNSVTSVEHDKEWFDVVKNNMPDNVSLNFQELVYGGDYSNASNLCGKSFDLVIVDGRDRVNCIKNSIHSLKSGGVLILDDSERNGYAGALEFLKKNGFRKIDFWGISPGLFYKKNTTIFYKDNNCIGI